MRMSTRVTRDIMVTKNTTDIMRTMARRVVTTEENIGDTAKVTDIKIFCCHVVTVAIFQVLILTPVLCSLEHAT
jgi:hypothetical protein